MVESEHPITAKSPEAFARQHEMSVADAFCDMTAMFILEQIVQSEEIGIEVTTENLSIHCEGIDKWWLSFAKLYKADFVNVYGIYIDSTEEGRKNRNLLNKLAEEANKNAQDAGTSTP